MKKNQKCLMEFDFISIFIVNHQKITIFFVNKSGLFSKQKIEVRWLVKNA